MSWSRMKWPAFKEYVLPRRTEKEFWAEGKAQAAQLQPHIPKNAVVLDYGCGPGRVLRYIEAKRRIGVDISPDFLREAVIHGIEPVNTGDGWLNLATGSVDFIYSLMVFQHIPRLEIRYQLEELRRVIKPDGGSWLQFPRDTDYYGPEYVFTETELEHLGLTFSPGSLYKYADGFHKDREWIASL